MAATWKLTANGIPFTAANQSLVAIYNNDSTAVIKIYRIILMNNQVTALTGSQNLLTVTRYTAGTIAAGNWLLTPVSFDSANTALSANITCASKLTVTTPTTTDVFLRIPWSNDEPAVLGGTIDEIETNNPYTTIVDYAFNDSNINPIVLRQTQTLSIQNVGLTATAPANAGLIDIMIEFTVE